MTGLTKGVAWLELYTGQVPSVTRPREVRMIISYIFTCVSGVSRLLAPPSDSDSGPLGGGYQ